MAWHVLASWVVYLGLLFGSVFAALGLVRAGVHDPLAIAAVLVGAGAILFGIQRIWAFRSDWRRWAKDAAVDALHGVFSTMDATALFQAAIIGLAVSAASWLAEAFGGTLWPTDWPLVAQLALALLIGDFGAYWLHRAAHSWGWLWPVHALHHSSARLYVLASARTHPINAVLTYTLQVIPLIVLGAPDAALLTVGVFTTVNGLLQHANIDLRLGPLNWVFAGPELHRWHHSEEMEESQKNYGTNLIVWDLVFGTRYLPEGEEDRLEVGLPEMAYRTNYFHHLLSPFRFKRLMRRFTPRDVPAVDDELGAETAG